MTRSKITFTIVFAFVTSLIHGQSSIEQYAYKAYLAQDISEGKEIWKKAIALAEKDFKSKPNDVRVHFKLAFTQFSLLSATMRDQDEDLFDSYVDQAEENLEKIIELDKSNGEPKAVLSALMGLKMGYSPWKGMYLGSKSSSLIEKALKQSPNSPLVWKFYANSKLFTPEMFGGDLRVAIESFEKTLQLFEQKELINNWLYLDTMAFLGQAYQKNNETQKAIALYEKALNVEPDFNWVKYVLLPKVKGK